MIAGEQGSGGESTSQRAASQPAGVPGLGSASINYISGDLQSEDATQWASKRFLMDHKAAGIPRLVPQTIPPPPREGAACEIHAGVGKILLEVIEPKITAGLQEG